MEKSSRIGVIGYGSWATALVAVLTWNGKRVNWYIRNRDILDAFAETGSNCKYLQDVSLDRALINATDSLDDVVSDSDIILIAMPSAYLKTYMEELSGSLDGKFIISAVKGIIPGEYFTVTEYFNRNLGIPYGRLGVMCGPTHAEEVSHRRMTYITLACKDEADTERIAGLFECPFLKVNRSSDIYGIEYAAILKNIYALAAGMAAGLGYGDNFIANLVANCAKEMESFLSMTNPAETISDDKNSLGDLMVTCYSTFSRNRRLGQLIGRGCTVKSALNEMTMVAEGYFASEGLHKICEVRGASLPIAEMVYNVLYCRASARKEMDRLAKLL